MKSIEQYAADTILEKGVRVRIPAPFFLRIFLVKRIGLLFHQPYLGTLMHVARLSVKDGFDLAELNGEINDVHELVLKHSKTLRKIVAVLYLNSGWKIRLFTGLVAKWLEYKLTPSKLAEIAVVVVAYSRLEDFTSTIRLIGAMRITSPRNLSHTENGS